MLHAQIDRFLGETVGSELVPSFAGAFQDEIANAFVREVAAAQPSVDPTFLCRFDADPPLDGAQAELPVEAALLHDSFVEILKSGYPPFTDMQIREIGNVVMIAIGVNGNQRFANTDAKVGTSNRIVLFVEPVAPEKKGSLSLVYGSQSSSARRLTEYGYLARIGIARHDQITDLGITLDSLNTQEELGRKKRDDHPEINPNATERYVDCLLQEGRMDTHGAFKRIAHEIREREAKQLVAHVTGITKDRKAQAELLQTIYGDRSYKDLQQRVITATNRFTPVLLGAVPEIVPGIHIHHENLVQELLKMYVSPDEWELIVRNNKYRYAATHILDMVWVEAASPFDNYNYAGGIV